MGYGKSEYELKQEALLKIEQYKYVKTKNPLASKFIEFLEDPTNIKGGKINTYVIDKKGYFVTSEDRFKIYPTNYRINYTHIQHSLSIDIDVEFESEPNCVFVKYKTHKQYNYREIRFFDESEFHKMSDIMNVFWNKEGERRRAEKAKVVETKFTMMSVKSHLDDVIPPKQQKLMNIKDGYDGQSITIDSKTLYKYDLTITKHKSKDEYTVKGKLRVAMPLDSLLKFLGGMFENMSITDKERKLFLKDDSE